jgi:hypothetical protein
VHFISAPSLSVEYTCGGQSTFIAGPYSRRPCDGGGSVTVQLFTLGKNGTMRDSCPSGQWRGARTCEKPARAWERICAGLPSSSALTVGEGCFSMHCEPFQVLLNGERRLVNVMQGQMRS